MVDFELAVVPFGPCRDEPLIEFPFCCDEPFKEAARSASAFRFASSTSFARFSRAIFSRCALERNLG